MAQDARTVRVYRRDGGGAWGSHAEIYGNGDQFALPGLTHEVTVDNVYDDILGVDGASLLR